MEKEETQDQREARIRSEAMAEMWRLKDEELQRGVKHSQKMEWYFLVFGIAIGYFIGYGCALRH